MNAVMNRTPALAVSATCFALGLSRATYYRRQRQRHAPKPRPAPPRALSPAEREEVRTVLHEERFVDLAPATVYATLLDEARYLCSIRTMYRILHQGAELRERRDQLRHPAYAAPELLACGANQLWSWDITKLRGPRTWSMFYLYVILDVFSRYVVGWMVAHRESSALAHRLIRDTLHREAIEPGTLIIHADRGSSMRSKPVALLLSDMGVTKSHSRPHVSNDNPYSEAHFKTLKYRPDFPDRFGCIEDARAFSRHFFGWYNMEHRHSGIGLLTPYDVHHGLAATRTSQRALVLATAYGTTPQRFTRGAPQPPEVPTSAWINKPVGKKTDETPVLH